MPEFLEYRYDKSTRTIMATYLMVLYVIAFLASVLYSGARGLNGVFDFSGMLARNHGMDPDQAVFWSTVIGIWAIGLVAGAYTIYGGLKAVVWSDLLQGAALLGGGAICLFFALKLLGGGSLVDGGGVSGGSLADGWRQFAENARFVDPATGAERTKLSVILPWNDPDVPWLAVFVGGLWIPNLFYWGLNQFITQRTLGARSLAEGQKGIYLACLFKLAIPFLIVMPGIMAAQLFGPAILQKAGGDVAKAGELAYPHLITQILPWYLGGVMLAALSGAVMSSFNSGLNSASTIFTIDLYGGYVNRHASPARQVAVGRWATAAIVVVACLWAPIISSFEGVFNYIQEIWGFISPGIVAAFLGGLVIRRAPAAAGKTALLLGAALYAVCRVPKWILESIHEVNLRAADGKKILVRFSEGASGADGPWEPIGGFLQAIYDFNNIAFLHHMFLVFVVLIAVMAVITWRRPRTEPIEFPRSSIDTTVPRSTYVFGAGIILVTIALYVIFR
jgi:SSS family solute:Na+ symporter